ncbi:uncharacterized protein [Ptychodera flava]|uniref:uncharacterized protein isoform X1 n=1 Tax=Ptychodera flava TaxID=63121 RepID=UPI00396AA557
MSNVTAVECVFFFAVLALKGLVVFSDDGCKISQNNDVIIVTEGGDLTMRYSVQLQKSLTDISTLTAELYKVVNSSTGDENIKIRAESRVDGDKSVEEFGRRLMFIASAGYQSMSVIIEQENVKPMHAGKFQLYLRISEPQDDLKNHLLSAQCNIFTDIDVRVEERRTTPGTTDSEPPGVESTRAPSLTDSITGDTTGILSQTNLIIIAIAVAFVMLVLIGLLILVIFFRRNSRPAPGTHVVYLPQPNAVML